MNSLFIIMRRGGNWDVGSLVFRCSVITTPTVRYVAFSTVMFRQEAALR